MPPAFPDWFFENLHNKSIRNLKLKPHVNLFCIASSLDAIETIEIDDRTEAYDWSMLRLDVMDKMLDLNCWELVYSPPNIPDREQLERIFTKKCQQKPWYKTCRLKIGHPQWLQHRHEFQLTFEFCKMLVDTLRNLRNLELYNVHDCYEELQAYLREHKPKELEKVVLNDEEALENL